MIISTVNIKISEGRNSKKLGKSSLFEAINMVHLKHVSDNLKRYSS